VSDRRLNIVIIILDSARRDRFGCYGYARPTTPAVDAFASGALVFDRMITPGPWTIPSHASLFTGLFPREHGAHFPTAQLRRGQPTLPSHLASSGYHCVAASANSLLVWDNNLINGFAEVAGRSRLEERTLWNRAQRWLTGRRDAGTMAVTRYVGDRIASWPRPYFLFVNFMECHWYYGPPYEAEARFVRGGTSRLASAARRRRLRSLPAWEAVATAGPDDLRLYSDLYDGALSWADLHTGRLIEAIDRAGGAKDTIVVVMADHGEHIGEGGLADHQGSLSQTLIHIPCVIRGPDGRRGHAGALVQTTDLAATLCRHAGVPLPGHLAGRDAVDLLALSSEAPGHACAFAEWQHWGEQKMASLQARAPHYDFSRLPRGLEAVQDRQFKLVVETETGRESLYDVAADPAETQDRAQQMPAVAARLRGALAAWRDAHPAAPETVYTGEEEAQVEARLRQLGYV
jgi:arylsulfatase A-like enzyme